MVPTMKIVLTCAVIYRSKEVPILRVIVRPFTYASSDRTVKRKRKRKDMCFVSKSVWNAHSESYFLCSKVLRLNKKSTVRIPEPFILIGKMTG